MSIIYEYNPNTMCPPGYHHNGFMATRALGTHKVRLHIVGIQEPKGSQANSRAMSIIFMGEFDLRPTQSVQIKTEQEEHNIRVWS